MKKNKGILYGTIIQSGRFSPKCIVTTHKIQKPLMQSIYSIRFFCAIM